VLYYKKQNQYQYWRDLELTNFRGYYFVFLIFHRNIGSNQTIDFQARLVYSDFLKKYHLFTNILFVFSKEGINILINI
jgi:hypothetical protein